MVLLSLLLEETEKPLFPSERRTSRNELKKREYYVKMNKRMNVNTQGIDKENQVKIQSFLVTALFFVAVIVDTNFFFCAIKMRSLSNAIWMGFFVFYPQHFLSLLLSVLL